MRNVTIIEVQNIIVTLREWAEDDNWEFWRTIILSCADILEKVIENPYGE